MISISIAYNIIQSKLYWQSLSLSSLTIGLMLLSGCSILVPPDGMQYETESTPAWIEHRDQITMIEQWKMRGVIKLQYQEQQWNFNMRWQCTAQSSALDLYTVRGDKLMEFSVTPQQAQAKDRKGEVYFAANGEELVRKILGVQIPITSLCKWLVGIPDSNAIKPRLQIDPQGRLVALVQSGWQIHYQDYQDYSYADNVVSLPGELTLEKKDVQITVSTAQRELVQTSENY